MLGTLVGFVALFLVLDRTAAALGSLRGEYGLLVCAVTLLAALAVERLLSDGPPRRLLADLGFRRPAIKALLAALAIAVGLIAVVPAFALTIGASLSLVPGWPLLALGMFAQGGLAEETVFRGFLFRRVRAGRRFWPAALLAALPFAAVHLLLFASLEPWTAAASLALAVSISFPLAQLFEQGGGSVWPPAIVHAAVQGGIKLVDAGDAFPTLAAVWIAAAALLPWAVFLGADKAK